ncbi:MAG: hypothetical protein ACOX0C_00270 [Patescibacteria group bacterium]|jgi:protein-S-isoprenylcysteine O-methyltransferase Ste14
MKKNIILFITLGIITLIGGAGLALAQNPPITDITDQVGRVAGFNQKMEIGNIVATIVGAVLSLLAVIFLVIMVMEGFKWMMAGGNTEQVSKSQTAIKNAIIGLIVVLAAYAITYFVMVRLPFSGSPSDIPSNNSGLTTSG